jgi:uncharacterized protein YjbJ (UPF0337 family)
VPTGSHAGRAVCPDRHWDEESRPHHVAKEDPMNKDQVKGRIDQAKGKVKETAGDLAGNARASSEGKADQVKGRVQAEVGDAKQKVKRTIDKA